MAYNIAQQSNTGSFVPTTNIWDVAQLYEVDVASPEFKELLVRLYQNVNNIALVLNTKDSAFYLSELFSTGQLYGNPASNSILEQLPGFRISIITGALAAGVKMIPHGLTVTSSWTAVSIWGGATNSAGPFFYPLPFAGAAGNNIEVTIDGTNININNQSGQTFTNSRVTWQLLQN